jgi:hypothetical protein
MRQIEIGENLGCVLLVLIIGAIVVLIRWLSQ